MCKTAGMLKMHIFTQANALGAKNKFYHFKSDRYITVAFCYTACSHLLTPDRIPFHTHRCDASPPVRGASHRELWVLQCVSLLLRNTWEFSFKGFQQIIASTSVQMLQHCMQLLGSIFRIKIIFYIYFMYLNNSMRVWHRTCLIGTIN
jgi:hypothetical protein